MRDYKGYEIVQISGSINPDKLKKAVRAGKITFAAEDLKGKKSVLMHPMSAKLIKRAQKKSKGVTSMMITASDILTDLESHGSKSIWSWTEEFKTRKAYKWIWDE
jgi:hypothetical protein